MNSQLSATGAVAGLDEARMVQSKINQLGIQDVQLFYDGQLKMWGVYQVKKTASSFIVPKEYQTIKPMLMWWCKGPDSKYRAPNDNDINDVIATVHRAQHWFEKGPDALVKALDEQDAERTRKKELKLKERLQPHIKTLKRAIRNELG
jgi:hypothetical protein